MQSRPHAGGTFVQHGACLRRANHALSRRSPVGRAAMRWASQPSGACSLSTSNGWKAILPSRSSRGIVPGPPREVIALREFSATGVCLISLLAGSSRLKWGGLCSAMACMDSLECLGYWDLVNLVVSNRSIYTS
jgi:hypothetical protein